MTTDSKGLSEADVKNLLKSDALARFGKRSNTKAFALVAANWLSIYAVFAMVAYFTNPLTIILAIFLLGGRMLAIAVIMHDCGHRAFFESKELNQWVGQWLCSYPVLNNLDFYAPGHLKHHKLAGTEDDPDLSNYRNYPVTRSSFKNKMVRDLTGQTGRKLITAVFKYNTGKYAGDKLMTDHLRNGLIAQGFILVPLALMGALELYLLWVIAYLTTYLWISRIRQIAEHANVPDLFDADPRLNTRTTYANWWERLLFAPNWVNYHIEHHLRASIPCYNLKAFHQYLKANGYYEGHSISPSYVSVIRNALQPAS